MSLAVLAKAIAVAVCAAFTATLYLVALSKIEHPSLAGYEMTWVRAGATLTATLFASFTIGFPVALLTFFLARRHLIQLPATLAMVTVLAGIMMVLSSYWIAEEDGVLIFGIPAFLAALTYGILGWFWILRPLRASQS